MLTVSLLVCAVMALTRAAAVPVAEHGNGTELLIQAVKNETGMVAFSCLWNRTGSGRCFFYIPTPMLWVDAECYCQDHGGNLASVHGFDEMDLIHNLTASDVDHNEDAWIGGSDAPKRGRWFWSDGTPFRFYYWTRGRADNRWNARCMVMNFAVEEGFDNKPCNNKLPFVCIRKIELIE